MSTKEQRERFEGWPGDAFWEDLSKRDIAIAAWKASEAATVERLPCYRTFEDDEASDCGYSFYYEPDSDEFCPRCAALRELKGES